VQGGVDDTELVGDRVSHLPPEVPDEGGGIPASGGEAVGGATGGRRSSIRGLAS
jgi:hypothetical protein